MSEQKPVLQPKDYTITIGVCCPDCKSTHCISCGSYGMGGKHSVVLHCSDCHHNFTVSVTVKYDD